MVEDFEFNEIELTEEALENAERYRNLDCDIFGKEFASPAECSPAAESAYLVEDFDEVNELFLNSANGDCKCPAQLLLLLWQERKYLKRKLRQEGLWNHVNKRLREGTEVSADG